MTPDLHILMAQEHSRDLILSARARRRSARPTAPPGEIDDLVIRRATSADRDALRRLEQLEGRRIGSADLLVAEIGGRVLAALPLEAGRPIADPFRRTASVIELLEARRDHLGGESRRRGGVRRRFRSRLEPEDALARRAC